MILNHATFNYYSYGVLPFLWFFFLNIKSDQLIRWQIYNDHSYTQDKIIYNGTGVVDHLFSQIYKVFTSNRTWISVYSFEKNEYIILKVSIALYCILKWDKITKSSGKPQ